MVDHERSLGWPASRASLLNDITGDATWQPTFVFYMCYPTLPAHASPRGDLLAMCLLGERKPHSEHSCSDLFVSDLLTSEVT